MNRLVALRSAVLDRTHRVSGFTCIVVAITTLALALRLSAVHRFGEVIEFRNGDQVHYQELARRLGQGEGYGGSVQFWRAPGLLR